jgi:hypothetical protein
MKKTIFQEGIAMLFNNVVYVKTSAIRNAAHAAGIRVFPNEHFTHRSVFQSQARCRTADFIATDSLLLL